MSALDRAIVHRPIGCPQLLRSADRADVCAAIVSPMDRHRSTELPRVISPALQRRFAIRRSKIRTEERRGNWQVLASGMVFTRPDEPERRDWADVGVALAGPGSAVTGWDAVHARGLGDRHPPSPLVVVLSPNGRNRVVGGVRIRRTHRPFAYQYQPLDAPLELTPLVALPRGVTDAALECRDLGSVRALVTGAVQRRACSVTDLIAEYDDGPRNRSGMLRTALTDLRDGARSAAEATAARRLVRGGLPPFELNVPVVDETGTLLYVVDELWRELRAAVEIDSREYHFSEADWELTMQRHNLLTRLGLAVTHYAPRLVTARGSTFVPEVGDWLRRRASELNVALPAGRGIRRPPLDTEPEPFIVRLHA